MKTKRDTDIAFIINEHEVKAFMKECDPVEKKQYPQVDIELRSNVTGKLHKKTLWFVEYYK